MEEADSKGREDGWLSTGKKAVREMAVAVAVAAAIAAEKVGQRVSLWGQEQP